MVARARLPTRHGEFTAWVYEQPEAGCEHLALVMGPIADGRPVLVRIHSECLTGDVLGSLRCDCGAQLQLALDRIAREKRGILLYLRQEGRGIGLYNKMAAYALQDQGLDTVEANEHLGFAADLRDYRVAARILANLGVQDLRLLTNNPRKVEALRDCGLRVVERLPLVAPPNEESAQYLRTKRLKMGHLLSHEDRG
jgi:GTP cyclohydrolase II